MTIELSLRLRAKRCRFLSAMFFCAAIAILIGAYFSLPFIAGETLDSINRIETTQTAPIVSDKALHPTEKGSFTNLYLFGLTTLILGASSLAFSCYLLGKGALFQIESAERLCGIADAICISDNSFENLEKASLLLVPKNKSQQELSTGIDLKSLAEVLKLLK